MASFWPLKCNMVRNAISSGQNENLRPILHSNRGIVTIKKWYQNLILTTRIVKKWVFRHFWAQKRLNFFFTILVVKMQFWDHFLSNYTPIALKKWSQIFISTTRKQILVILHFIAQKKCKERALYGHEPYENGSKFSKPSHFVIVEVVEHFIWGCSSNNQQKKGTVGISPLQSFLANM